MSYDRRTPVVVIAGFLGAGKTTLLKSVLESPDFANTMVIVNEIGEVGIDHQLLERSEDETVLLDNGCMCCQLRGDLQTLLVDLKMRANRGEIPSFERVVIEMSGLADPGPVAQTIYSDAALIHDYHVARIVTLLDPTSLQAIKAAPTVAEAQIAAADLLILSKTDVADEEQLGAVVDWARSINQFAECMDGAASRVDVALLAKSQTSNHAAAFYADIDMRAGRAPARFPLFDSRDAEQEDGLPEEGSYLSRRSLLHPTNVSSFVMRFPFPLARTLFDLFISILVRLRGEDLLRVKGVVYFQGSSDPYSVQGVRHIFAEPVRLRPVSGQSGESALVVVANNLPQQEVRALWLSLNALSGQREPDRPS